MSRRWEQGEHASSVAGGLKNPHSWLRVGVRLAKIAVVGHVFFRYVGGIGSTQGVSMQPTIPPGYQSTSRILYSTLHRRGRGIKVGDVITYTHPMFPKTSGCKRVIGMPGDFVSVITPPRGDQDLETVDVHDKWATVKEQVIQVPEGHCWVAGDNLEWSRDSRLYGPLPLGLVESKVLAVVTPWSAAKWLGAHVDLKDVQDEEKASIMTRFRYRALDLPYQQPGRTGIQISE